RECYLGLRRRSRRWNKKNPAKSGIYVESVRESGRGALAPAAPECDGALVAAEVVHHPGAIAAAAGEEAVEAAAGILAAVGRAGDHERRRIRQADDGGAGVGREVLVAVDPHAR